MPYRNDGFILRGNWVSKTRDDCIENDANAEGASGTLRIVGNLIKMQNMPGPYERHKPLGNRSKDSYGNFWKTRSNAGVPKIVLRDNMIAFEQPGTNLTGANVNVVECANNTILWLGSSAFPGQLPAGREDCFRIVAGSEARQLWQELRQRWIDDHPNIARL